MATKLGVDVRSIRLLLEIGVTAAYEGLPSEGESIVRGVQSFRDDVPQPGVCLIGAFFFQKRYEEAIVEAKAVLKRFPNCQMAKALLGLAMFDAGYRDWETPLKEVVDDGRDEWAIKLAMTTLGYDYKRQGSGTASPAASAPPAGMIYA
jgi:hypothetical protein